MSFPVSFIAVAPISSEGTLFVHVIPGILTPHQINATYSRNCICNCIVVAFAKSQAAIAITFVTVVAVQLYS